MYEARQVAIKPAGSLYFRLREGTHSIKINSRRGAGGRGQGGCFQEEPDASSHQKTKEKPHTRTCTCTVNTTIDKESHLEPHYVRYTRVLRIEYFVAHFNMTSRPTEILSEKPLREEKSSSAKFPFQQSSKQL